MTIHEVCSRLPGTLVAEQWQALLTLYDEIDRYAASFQNRHRVACPPGCGTCCEHFTPDLTDEEASLMAAYLLFVKQDQGAIASLAQSGADSQSCPLYDPESTFHCTVYPARGMICRLFGACPSEDKHHRPVFRKCKYNTLTDTPVKLEMSDFEGDESPVLTMNSFGMQLQAISMHAQTMPLPEALTVAAMRLRFLFNNGGFNPNDNDSGPDVPNTPTPVAS